MNMLGSTASSGKTRPREQPEKETPDPLAFVQRFVDGIPNPIFYKDPTGVFRICNSAYEKLAGRPRREILGRTARDIFPPAAAAEQERHDRALWVSGRVQSYDFPFKATDGSPRRGLCRTSLISGPKGEPIGLTGIVTDVTDMVNAQEAVRQSETWLRALMENALDLVVVIDPTGVIRFLSASVERILGWSAAQMIGGSIFAYIHPEDGQTAKESIARSLHRQPGEEQFVLLRFRSRSGGWRTLEVIGNNRLADPGVKGIIVNARDVTQRLEAAKHEERKEEIPSPAAPQAAPRSPSSLEIPGLEKDETDDRLLAGAALQNFDTLVQSLAARAASLSTGDLALSSRTSLSEIASAAQEAGRQARTLLEAALRN